MIGKRVDSRVGELNRVMTPEARGTSYHYSGLAATHRLEWQTIHRRALSMFQQLFQLIIPNKPRSDKVQVPEPNQLTPMLTHSYCAS